MRVPPNHTGNFKWTDGVVEKSSPTCPGPGFRRGRKPFPRKPHSPETIRKAAETRKARKYPAWNKGLTKETSPIMAQMAQSLKEYKQENPYVPWNKGKNDACQTEWDQYKKDVSEITEANYREHKDAINPDNLPRTLAGVDGGYHLDHIIPRRYGFDNDISPEEIGAVENLQMLPWRDNLVKRDKV